jgi:hypothetical protein
MVNEVKLCKDCEHYISTRLLEHCCSPENGIRLTDGRASYGWAASRRMNEEACGASAKWFVLKEVPPIQPKQPLSWIKKLW